jgi:arylformamidase
MPLPIGRIVDISLEVDEKNFRMQVMEGFKRDMQFEIEVIKEHDAAKGIGQIVRGVHMRLHAGSHIDAPEHFVKGGKQVHELPLSTFIGDAVVADFSDKKAAEGITAENLEVRIGEKVKRGDRLLIRTDLNKRYFDMEIDEWKKVTPHLTPDALQWVIDHGIVLVGVDFYHGAKAPGQTRNSLARVLLEAGVVTMPYLTNLDQISKDRVTLVAAPLKIMNVEATPVRALVIE